MRHTLLRGFTALIIAASLLTELRAQSIYTVAGGVPDDGLALASRFRAISGLAVDAGGNVILADGGENLVRRINAERRTITTIAGNGAGGFSGDGAAAVKASLNLPSQVAVDGAGNVYIADTWNDRVRRIDARTGTISTLFRIVWDTSQILALDVDRAGNAYVATIHGRSYTCGITRVDGATGQVVEILQGYCGASSGDGGPASAASTQLPRDLAIDAAGNVFIAEDRRIRKIEKSTGVIVTFAGTGEPGSTGDGGPANKATIAGSPRIALDADGSLYMADGGSIRRIDATTGTIDTIATLDVAPNAIDVSPSGIFVSDTQHVWSVDPRTGRATLIAGGGAVEERPPATSASLLEPMGIAIDRRGNIFVAEAGGQHRILRVDAQTGVIETIAGAGEGGVTGDGIPATTALLNDLYDLEVDRSGNVYLVEPHRIRRIDAVTGIITTIAGNGLSGFAGDDGPATAALIGYRGGIAVDPDGNVYFADRDNYRVRRIDARTGTIKTVAGNGQTDRDYSGDGKVATEGAVGNPISVAISPTGDLHIVDGPRIRRVDAATQIISTVAGIGQPYCNGPSGQVPCPAAPGDGGPATSAVLYDPTSIAFDGAGNLYIANGSYATCNPAFCWSAADYRVRRVNTRGIIETVAGKPAAGVPYAGGAERGFAGDGARAVDAMLNVPQDIEVDEAGNIYVSDTGNRRVRVVSTCTGLPSPELVWPSNASASVTDIPRLTWTVPSRAFSYDLYVDTANPPLRKAAAGLSATSYEVRNLTAGTTHYWRVVARADPLCSGAISVISPVWSFTTAMPGPRRRSAVAR